MGSVLFEAVNPSFAPQYTFHDAPRSHTSTSTASNRSPASRRSGSPMSSSDQRASGSSATRTASQHQHSQTTPTQDVAQRPSQHAQHTHQRTTSARPSSPPLAATVTTPTGDARPHGLPDDPPTASPRRSRGAKIKVRDLEHIQSFASQDTGAFSEIRSQSRSRSRSEEEDSPQYEISDMKVEHIIEMVAGLLTKITTTNDQQHEHLHRQPPYPQSASHLSPQTTSVLAFHGKNVPSITILSYLSRINKYCPTSYEVFLSLLVYFDRMTERVNAAPMQSLRQANAASAAAAERNDSGSSSSSSSANSEDMEGITATTEQDTQTITPPSSGNLQKAAESGIPGTPHSRSLSNDSPTIPPQPTNIDQYNLSHFFVVDSFNIHRLVIAGVTCASKFFSDIFYTNSRYAKVGGLPLPELNHLELQFLLLNDFRLSIPVEEIEAYGTMLVEFYAREVVAQQKAADAEAMEMRSLSESSSESVATVRAA